METFSNVQLKPINGAGQIKASGKVLVMGTIEVNFKVVAKKAGGYFVSWPQREYKDKEGNTKYSNEVWFPNEETRNQANETVLAEFNKLGDGESAPKQAKSSGGYAKKNQNIPF